MGWRRSIGVAGLLCLLAVGSARGAESISAGQLVGAKGIVVPPVEKIDVTRLVDAGTIGTDGFAYMVVNMGGELKDSPNRQGVVGALLVPDIAPFDMVLAFHNIVPVPLEIKAPVNAETHPSFMAKQVRFEVGFPKYRVLLYNTTGTTVTVTLTAYRTQ
jgi:hypothetical protein